MADDARGFQRFDDFQFFIANERAWDAPGVNKRFTGEGEPAFDDPGNAELAIQRVLENRFPTDQISEDGEFAYTTEIPVDDFF